MPIIISAIALLGLAVGSFLNVVIYRVPMGESLVRPGSHCPHCAMPIRSRHNVPVLGWLLLRGHCADCAAPISGRYPLVELATSVLFVATTLQLAHADLLAASPVYLGFVAAGIAIAAIDFDGRLPNSAVFLTYTALAPLLVAECVSAHSIDPLSRAAIATSAAAATLTTIALVRPGSVSLRQARLIGVIGGMFGFVSYTTFAVLGLALVAAGVARLAFVHFRPFALPLRPPRAADALTSVGFAGTSFTTALISPTGPDRPRSKALS